MSSDGPSASALARSMPRDALVTRAVFPCKGDHGHVAQAFIPPSTVRFAPVTYEDSGLARNETIAAISLTCP
jgi:hypothetical protein